MIVLRNGTISYMSRDEFYKLVFNARQSAFLKSFADIDFAELELRALAVQGREPNYFITDELVEEPEPVKNKPHIKTNRRTKKNKHPLPFYLGSNRRY